MANIKLNEAISLEKDNDIDKIKEKLLSLPETNANDDLFWSIIIAGLTFLAGKWDSLY